MQRTRVLIEIMSALGAAVVWWDLPGVGAYASVGIAGVDIAIHAARMIRMRRERRAMDAEIARMVEEFRRDLPRIAQQSLRAKGFSGGASSRARSGTPPGRRP